MTCAHCKELEAEIAELVANVLTDTYKAKLTILAGSVSMVVDNGTTRIEAFAGDVVNLTVHKEKACRS
jgi:hypothetical protein